MKSLSKLIVTVLVIATSMQANASELSIKINSNNESYKQTLQNVLKDLNQILPEKFISSLPKDIELKIEKLSNHQEIPSNICKEDEDIKDSKARFIYGEYRPLSNALVLNVPVVEELKKGKLSSKKINCQHKSLYDQALATIIHELSHAYDNNNGQPSSTYEFLRRAGFKKGLLRIKNKNVNAQRSADPYELTSVKESFAVNFEYFIQDEEYACRRPSMFDYYKNLFLTDPFPSRKCELNKKVMLSSMQGFIPVDLDPSRVYRVDYLLASPGKELSSGFGHSMFRLVVCAPDRIDPITNKRIPATPYGKKCLEDKLFHVVVSYRANVEDATLNYLKGVFGGYPSMLFILSFSDVLDEYNRDELRDLYAYPLKLSNKEKDDVVKKVIEEHWNYRGAYKFFTNNCATESLDLLKASLNNDRLNKNKVLTPKGFLEDLDKLELLDEKNPEMETYHAKTDSLIEAYKSAYGYKSKNSKEDKKALLKFIDESSADLRREGFQKASGLSINLGDDHLELFEYKKKLIRMSSFSVLEQQILRTIGSKFRKKAADLYFNTKDEELKKKLDDMANNMKSSFSDLASAGYGVPLTTEMKSTEDLKAKLENTSESMKKVEELFRQNFPSEFETLNKISENILMMNDVSIKTRKIYREKLERYVLTVLMNLNNSDTGHELMLSAKNNDKNALLELRNKLDANLISEKEILDAKLIKIISQIIE